MAAPDQTHAATQQADERWRAALGARVEVEGRLTEAQRRLGVVFADQAFFAQEHSRRHLSLPWDNAEGQRLRDDVFSAAIALHRAFADAAAKPLRHNLGALMNVWSGPPPPGAGKQALLPDLWSSLFLVVPLVSTTFASVNRMFGKLPVESLGWLLVDEAGQALPQAAVGALRRCQRAVVVGDPVQIEPVVALPGTLTQAICRRFGVDPDRFNAPAASVQMLADTASVYASEFPAGAGGSRPVGVPLLVHRRCEEPMFGVSNEIAYAKLMVQAKKLKPSRIREVLGPSAWFDVESVSAEDKWSAAEGAVVVRLLLRGSRLAAVFAFALFFGRGHGRKRSNSSDAAGREITPPRFFFPKEMAGTDHCAPESLAPELFDEWDRVVLPEPGQTGVLAARRDGGFDPRRGLGLPWFPLSSSQFIPVVLNLCPTG